MWVRSRRATYLSGDVNHFFSRSRSRTLNAQQTEFRRELDRLGSWQERAQRIQGQLKQTESALAMRQEKLLGLRSDFDALTLDFWKAFGRGLGCENPQATILARRARMRSLACLGAIGFIAA